MKDILQERFFQLLLECSQRKASATEFSEAIEEFNPPIFLPKWRKRKSSKILEFQNFALIFYLLSRCVRDSNPWPHAWQACILTNWTNAPLPCFLAISLDCGCKGRHFFEICNTVHDFFCELFIRFALYYSYWEYYMEEEFCKQAVALIWNLSRV